MKHQLHILNDDCRQARPKHLAGLLQQFDDEGQKVLVILPSKAYLVGANELPSMPIVRKSSCLSQYRRWVITSRSMYQLAGMALGDYFDVIICTHLECFTGHRSIKFNIYCEAIHNEHVQRNIVVCRKGGRVPPDNATWLLKALLKMSYPNMDKALSAYKVPFSSIGPSRGFVRRLYPENWWTRLVGEFWGEQVSYISNSGDKQK